MAVPPPVEYGWVILCDPVTFRYGASRQVDQAQIWVGPILGEEHKLDFNRRIPLSFLSEGDEILRIARSTEVYCESETSFAPPGSSDDTE